MENCQRMTFNCAAPARDLRRVLGRARTLVLGVIVALLIVAGERWLLVEDPSPGIQFRLAIDAAAAIGASAADVVGIK